MNNIEVDAVNRPSIDLIFPRLLIERGTKQPDSPFLREVGGADYTYGQVLDQGLRLANAMRAMGVGPGDRVASMIPTSADSVIIMAAAALLNAIHVPINNAYVGYMLEHALVLTTPTLLILQDEYVTRLGDVAMPDGVQVVVRGENESTEQKHHATYEPLLDGEALNLSAVEQVQWDETGTLLFTSGTTGASKAVIIPWYHLYLSSERMWQSESLDENTRFYCPWPINHVTGAGAVYLMALLGGVLVLRSKWSTSNFVKDINDYQCTLTDLMAEMVHYFEHMEGLENTPLTHIFIAPVTEGVGEVLEDLGIEYCTNYNSTETNSPIGSVGYEPVPVASAGRLRPGVQIRIVDEDAQDVADGQPGELLIKTDDSAAMNGGYWGMPKATEQAWRGGWFHTGDLLRVDEDGFFYLAGRLKDRIRVRGENVNPDEIEAVLRGLPNIYQCAAVGQPLPDGGDEIFLFVVTTGGEFDEAAARAFCALKLPKFMRPARYIVTDELPMTPTGKVQRASLRARMNE